MGSLITNHAVQLRELSYAEQYASLHGGVLPRDAFWDVVIGRFDVAIDTGHLERFEHYHPRITPLLLRDMGLKEVIPPNTPPPHSTPVVPMLPPPPVMAPLPAAPPVMVPVVPVVPPGAIQTPHAVPEPATAIMLAFGLLGTWIVSMVK